MEPKFMGITSLPRTATQGPLNVPRETIPQFQQGGGLFATAPGLSIDTTPTFNLNLAPQGLSDPRQPVIIPTEETMYFSPQVPASSGLSLVDPSIFLDDILPSDAITGETGPVAVGSPDTMYGTGGVNVMNLTGVPTNPAKDAAANYGGSISDPEFFRNIRGNQRTFDNAMDTFADQLSKAQATNVLYGGATALPRGEATKNAFTESEAGMAAEQARIDFINAERQKTRDRLGPTQYGDRANLLEDYNRMLAGETTGVSGKSLIELGIVNPFEGPALMSAGVQSPVFSNYDPALAAEFDYSPENISELLRQAEYRGPVTMVPNQTGRPMTPLDMESLQKSDPARFNAIMEAMAGPPNVVRDPNAVPYVAPIDFSRSGTAKKAMGGGIMSLNPNY